MSTTRKKNVTLKMVAERAACSIAVVSTVLNNARGNSAVSAKTRKHIQDIANTLGYHPNFLSRSLKSRCSRTIGIYVQPSPWRSIALHYESSILGGVESAACKREYDILILNLSSQTLPQICERRIAESRIDGVLLIHADHSADWIDQLTAATDRVVAVDCCMQNEQLSRVIFSNDAAVTLALRHLAEKGHRRIGFIGNCVEEVRLESPDRETPYRQTVCDLGLDNDPQLIYNTEQCQGQISLKDRYCEREGELGMRKLLSLTNPPTAVLAYNSLVALFAMREAQRQKKHIPEQISVVGIDDHELIPYFQPQLTRIDHPLHAMGRAGANLLIDLIEGHSTAPCVETFAPALIPGDSVAEHT